jgi:hypothetical protein
MKNSDSKNSLAELNPPEPLCFICLEEASPDAPLIESSLLRSCGCKFFTHADCWNTWRKEKSDYDCPYCGKRSLHMSIPMTAPFQQVYTSELNTPSSKKRKIFLACLTLSVICTVSGILLFKMLHSD